MTKTEMKIRSHPAVAEVWYETGDGWFALLKDGYKCAGTDCQTCREETLTRLLQAVRNAIRENA